jgi:uncharacterized membrane protein YpjA
MRFVRWVIYSPVLWLVVLANLGGAIAGYVFWYGDSILAAPWYYWIFVPDCPLAATLMGFALISYRYGRRWDLLGLLATGTCIKYGLWTVVYWAANYVAGGQYNFESVTMSITHFIMIVEGFMLTSILRFRLVPVAIASLFLIGNDLVDYVAGYHPGLPFRVDVRLMAGLAIAMTAVFVVFWGGMTWISARRARMRRAAPPVGANLGEAPAGAALEGAALDGAALDGAAPPAAVASDGTPALVPSPGEVSPGGEAPR